MMEIPLRGNVSNVSLVRLLVNLSRSRKTGTLSVRTPVFTKNIYVDAGNAIFASSTYEDDRLGEMLLKADKITVEQYDKSVEMLKSSGKRQGAILVELGYITPKDLFWGVKYQVREIIHSVFQIEDGEYEFKEGNIPTQEVITIKMSMGNLIYEGVKKIDNWTRIRREMPDTGSVLKLSEDPLNLFQDIELSPQDKKILSLVDGERTINEVIEHSWMGSFEALKILYVLWSIGMVEPAFEKPGEDVAISLKEVLRPVPEEEEYLLQRIETIYHRLGSMTLHELLEVDATADEGLIKRNYYRLAKEFHPDRYFTIRDDSVRTKLTSIFDAITNAYNVLREEKGHHEYSGSAGVPGPGEDVKDAKAEELFKSGIDEFKKKNFQGAVENFTQAAELVPDNAIYWNYLSLACSRIPGKIRESEDALSTAIKIEPMNADFHANMGLIYSKAGLKEKARAQFEKALGIDPSNTKAKKGLKQTKE
jgi:tetratricopeptide (TPR) repeat protein